MKKAVSQRQTWKQNRKITKTKHQNGKETNTNEYITQAVAKATRAAIQTMSAENVRPRMSGCIMKQPTFDWSAKDKYAEVRNFKLEVKTCSRTLNISQTEKGSIIKNWLGRQDLQLLEILMQAEQEAYNGEEGLSKNTK